MKLFGTVSIALAILIQLPSAGIAAEAAGETVVPIKVIVMLKDRAKDGPKPFPNVGGFLIRRSSAELKNASCPDDSNGKGELICTLKCMKGDGNLRLQVVPPLKKRAPIVAGMSAPVSAVVDIENCAIKTGVTIKADASVKLVYRTALAMAEELQDEAPEIFAAVATLNGTTLNFKSLKETAPALQQLAKTPSNREKLRQLAQLGEVYKDAVAEGVSTPLGANVSEYASGAHSIALQAAVTESMGSAANALVTVSASKGEFYRSVNNVSQALSSRSVLSENEIKLSRDVNGLKNGASERLYEGVAKKAEPMAAPVGLERLYQGVAKNPVPMATPVGTSR